jgi:heterodisulfide reductase subunit B
MKGNNEMKRVGYYPGCSLLASAREYNESLHAIIKIMGIELVEVPDWNCCGASSAHSLNHELSISLPARILSLAAKLDVEELLVPCAACYNRLMVAGSEIAEDDVLRTRISENIGMDYGFVRPTNVLEFLTKNLDSIKENISRKFNMKAACYYGCLLVRPQKILKFDQYEYPQGMDDIISALGGTTVDWSYKTECCGASHSIARTTIVGRLSARIVDNAVKNGADAIIVACPMCHSNLDMRRNKINKAAGKKYSIPVIYITQAVGMAFGFDQKTLGLFRHIVNVKLPASSELPSASAQNEIANPAIHTETEA